MPNSCFIHVCFRNAQNAFGIRFGVLLHGCSDEKNKPKKKKKRHNLSMAGKSDALFSLREKRDGPKWTHRHTDRIPNSRGSPSSNIKSTATTKKIVPKHKRKPKYNGRFMLLDIWYNEIVIILWDEREFWKCSLFQAEWKFIKMLWRNIIVFGRLDQREHSIYIFSTPPTNCIFESIQYIYIHLWLEMFIHLFSMSEHANLKWPISNCIKGAIQNLSPCLYFKKRTRFNLSIHTKNRLISK